MDFKKVNNKYLIALQFTSKYFNRAFSNFKVVDDSWLMWWDLIVGHIFYTLKLSS